MDETGRNRPKKANLPTIRSICFRARERTKMLVEPFIERVSCSTYIVCFCGTFVNQAFLSFVSRESSKGMNTEDARDSVPLCRRKSQAKKSCYACVVAFVYASFVVVVVVVVVVVGMCERVECRCRKWSYGRIECPHCNALSKQNNGVPHEKYVPHGVEVSCKVWKHQQPNPVVGNSHTQKRRKRN